MEKLFLTINDMKKMKLVLANGREFSGLVSGAEKHCVGEIVFNTSVVGYQEILSDPAYAGKIVVMTYPLMGQYGITDDDFESRVPVLKGMVARECCDSPSNFRFTKTLSEELDEHGIPCLTGVDTRMITRIIRDEGSMMAAIVDESMPVKDAQKLMKETAQSQNAVGIASCTKRWFSRTPHHKFDVVVIDCGLKHSVVAELNKRGCNVTVVPFNATEKDIMSFNPNGVLVSSGPGDPASLKGTIDVIKTLRGKLPIFGIGLGHEIIALACGAKCSKLKCGQHGGYPVRETGQAMIISAEYNCGYSVEPASLKGTGLEISHENVLDGSIAGLRCPADKLHSVQFYPEGAPGPKESPFFDEFINAMED